MQDGIRRSLQFHRRAMAIDADTPAELAPLLALFAGLAFTPGG